MNVRTYRFDKIFTLFLAKREIPEIPSKKCFCYDLEFEGWRRMKYKNECCPLSSLKIIFLNRKLKFFC